MAHILQSIWSVLAMNLKNHNSIKAFALYHFIRSSPTWGIFIRWGSIQFYEISRSKSLRSCQCCLGVQCTLNSGGTGGRDHRLKRNLTSSCFLSEFDAWIIGDGWKTCWLAAHYNLVRCNTSHVSHCVPCKTHDASNVPKLKSIPSRTAWASITCIECLNMAPLLSMYRAR